MARNAKRAPRSGHSSNGVTVTKETVTAMHTHREGPIPDSAEMAAYENIQEGFANRILTMAEENGRHRRELEKIALQADAKN